MSYFKSSRLLVVLCALRSLGCASDFNSTPGRNLTPECLKLTMTEGSLKTEAPARVSMFFTVDTCSGAPISGLKAESFVIAEDGKNVSVFESQQTVQARGRSFRLFSLLLLDLSGSMLRSGHFPALQEAASLYVDRILANQGDGQRVAIAAFDGRSAIIPLMDFSNDPVALKAAIARLSQKECDTSAQCSAYSDRKTCSGWLCVDDSTNLNGAVSQGIDRLELAIKGETEIPFKESALVVFTDGTDQAARVPDNVVYKKVDDSKTHVMTIGLGGEIDEPALRSIGKDGFEPVINASELGSAFDEIANRILGLANRFYLLEYCSPKRSGKHNLKVTVDIQNASGQSLQGSLEETFDATGFESGCTLPGSSTP